MIPLTVVSLIIVGINFSIQQYFNVVGEDNCNTFINYDNNIIIEFKLNEEVETYDS